MAQILDIQLECTPCDTLVDFIPPCFQDNAGGNDFQIYITNTCNIDSISYNNNGVIDAITLKSGSRWFDIRAALDTVAVTETLSIINGSFTKNITFQLGALVDAANSILGAAGARDFIQSLANPANKFSMVIEANHGGGVRYLYGDSRRGLRIADDTSYNSNLTIEELAGFTVTFQGSGRLARPIADSVVINTTPVP
jgi:hypothetical protein